jgi:hypothetical protein
MVIIQASAAIQAGSENAVLLIAIEGNQSSVGQLMFVYGKPYNGVGKDGYDISLPGIDVTAITRALNIGGAKHTTFSSKGNQFSRIAWLVQAGYSAALGQAFEPPPSNVVFRWTAKDLRRYVDKWVARMDNSGAYQNSARRGMLDHKGAAKIDALSLFRELATGGRLKTYYTYTSDSTVTVTHDTQKKQMEAFADRQAMEAGSVNWS